MKPGHVRISRQVYVGTVRHAFFNLPEQHGAVLIATGSSRRKRSRPETLPDSDVPHVKERARNFLAIPLSIISTMVTLIPVVTRRGPEVQTLAIQSLEHLLLSPGSRVPKFQAWALMRLPWDIWLERFGRRI